MTQRSARLSLAFEGALAPLPSEGPILVLGPRGQDDLAPLPLKRLRILQSFKPDFDAWSARGASCVAQAAEEAALEAPVASLVCLPRARADARAMLWLANARTLAGGPIWVDGQKTDGADSILKELRKLLPVSEAISKAHGKLFAFTATPDALPAEWQARPTEIEEGFITLPGIFSADGIDTASALLAAALPEKLNGEVLDLGAGWGYLSRAALSRKNVRKIELVEADANALACARQNITDERAEFHWADATQYKRLRGADHIICNPPFHHGRDADPALGQAFLMAAKRLLAPHGTLWLVANRHLPYDKLLTEGFAEVEDLGGDRVFRLTRASRPRKPRP